LVALDDAWPSFEPGVNFTFDPSNSTGDGDGLRKAQVVLAQAMQACAASAHTFQLEIGVPKDTHEIPLACVAGEMLGNVCKGE
jgi:hypothetical protein